MISLRKYLYCYIRRFFKVYNSVSESKPRSGTSYPFEERLDELKKFA
jgi:hypothetical protein